MTQELGDLPLYVPQTRFQRNLNHHRWELPVLCYHRIMVNYPYPFWGVIFMVNLHGFIRQIYHKKTVQLLPFPPLYDKLPNFFYRLPHFTFSEKCIKLSLSQRMTEQFIKNR